MGRIEKYLGPYHIGMLLGLTYIGIECECLDHIGIESLTYRHLMVMTLT